MAPSRFHLTHEIRDPGQGEEIILDPHVTGGCVIILDGAAATPIVDQLGEWLG